MKNTSTKIIFFLSFFFFSLQFFSLIFRQSCSRMNKNTLRLNIKEFKKHSRFEKNYGLGTLIKVFIDHMTADIDHMTADIDQILITCSDYQIKMGFTAKILLIFRFLQNDELSSVAITLDNPRKLMILGTSKDFGYCQATTKVGKQCNFIVNR